MSRPALAAAAVATAWTVVRGHPGTGGQATAARARWHTRAWTVAGHLRVTAGANA